LRARKWAWMQPYVDPVVLAACLPCGAAPALFRPARGHVRHPAVAPEDLDAHVRSIAEAAGRRHGFTDHYTYVARVGRATLIEITFVTPPGWQVEGIGQLDRIRQEVGEALGGKGPDRWLTIAFTEDPTWGDDPHLKARPAQCQ
jgi:predicted Co/Zn/Cd cation transporter (cation efflux family)